MLNNRETPTLARHFDSRHLSRVLRTSTGGPCHPPSIGLFAGHVYASGGVVLSQRTCSASPPRTPTCLVSVSRRGPHAPWPGRCECQAVRFTMDGYDEWRQTQTVRWSGPNSLENSRQFRVVVHNVLSEKTITMDLEDWIDFKSNNYFAFER